MGKKFRRGNSLVLLVILLWIILVTSNSSQLQAESSAESAFRAHLCVNLRGSEYFSQMMKKTKLGQPVSDSQKFDFSKLGISQPKVGKRVLITFSNSGCSGCQKFQPLFQEWVKKHSVDLEIIAVLYGPPQTNDKIKAELVAAGLQVVTFSELTGLIDSQYEDFETLLIDEEGRVTYGLYSFDLSKWKRVDQLVDDFASLGQIKADSLEYLERGAIFSWDKLTDITGQEFIKSDFMERPTVWFLNWPYFKLNSFLYPIIKNIQAKFASEINLALILYNNDPIADLTAEYYQRYDLESKIVKQGMEDLTEFAMREGLEGIPIFADQEWQLFNYSAFETTPSVVICDENLRVLEVLNLGRCLNFTAAEGNLTVEQVLIELFR